MRKRRGLCGGQAGALVATVWGGRSGYSVDSLTFRRYTVLVLWSEWTGGCVNARLVPTAWWEGITRVQRGERAMGLLERPVRRVPASDGAGLLDNGFRSLFPTLSSYLADAQYGDGTAR